MVINWFPGHMKKTITELEKQIKQVSAIIYVLDARIPQSSLNPVISSIAKNKPILYVLNKADLADDGRTNYFVNRLADSENHRAISTVSSGSQTRKKILSELEALLSQKILAKKEKNINMLYKVMVIGVPNTGKSSIINSLASKSKTITGNKAGVTKSLQWVKIGEQFALLDTPGTLWPKFDDNLVALKLAFVGSIKDDVLDIEELGYELMSYLVENFRPLVEMRYGKITGEDMHQIYDQLCTKRGYILKGGQIDYLRAGRGFLEEFRSGRFGKISLD